MESIQFKGIELLNIPVWNKPSYMQQSVYGRETVIPIIEPVDLVSPKECAEARSKVTWKIESAFDIVALFFQLFPETDEGKLKDYKEITFLGFKYYYHPKHKTRYGAISKFYMLLPIIARYYYKEFMKYQASDVRFLPRGYKDGTARGLEITPDVQRDLKDRVTDAIDVHKDRVYKEFGMKRNILIPITKRGSAGRVTAKMRSDASAYEQFDEWAEQFKKELVYPNSEINDIGLFVSALDNTNKFFVCMFKPDKPPVDCDNKPLPQMGVYKDLVFYQIENADTFEEAAMRYYVD